MRYTTPLCVPRSINSTMFLCFNAAATSISRMKRRIALSLTANSGNSVLIATARPVVSSDLIDKLDDVFVFQCCGNVHLAHEATHCFVTYGKLRQQRLDSDCSSCGFFRSDR